jgi:hypothetical protein
MKKTTQNINLASLKFDPPTRTPTRFPSVFPTTSPSAAPTFTPSAAPSVAPTLRPSNDPTTSPSAAPTVRPSSDPTTSPSAAPSVAPTLRPSNDPTTSPSAAPTARPSSAPSSEPTFNPSAVPTLFPTSNPTAEPTGSPTQEFIKIYIKYGGSYIGTEGKDEFIIDSPLSVTITGGDKMDRFTILRNEDILITITDFDLVNEQINLTVFTSIHSIRDLNIDNNSSVITLPNNEKINLQNIDLSQLKTGHFIFAPKPALTLEPSPAPSIPTKSNNHDNHNFLNTALGKVTLVISSLVTFSGAAWGAKVANTGLKFWCTGVIKEGYSRPDSSRSTIHNICGKLYKDIDRSLETAEGTFENRIRIAELNSLYPIADAISTSFDAKRDEEIGGADIDIVQRDYPMIVGVEKGNKYNVLLSIDAMMDPEHAEAQNKAFIEFISQITYFINKELPKDISLLLSSKPESEILLFEYNIIKNQALAIYESQILADHPKFIDSNDLIPYLLNAKQILYNLPLIHYISQTSMNHLGYNITSPDPSDNKAVLVSVDLVLGNMAAQYLPAENIMNAMFISTASTLSFAVRLTAVDYLRSQESSDDPIEFAQQCASTIAAYSLPEVVNYALTKAILPDAKLSITTLDMLGRGSLGVAQCYSNYKTLYASEIEPTISNIVLPYIVDALTLWSLRGYLSFDNSDTTNLIVGIKNAMSVAVTVYASDAIARMAIDVVPDEFKESYIDPVLDYVGDGVSSFLGDAYGYFA